MFAMAQIEGTKARTCRGRRAAKHVPPCWTCPGLSARVFLLRFGSVVGDAKSPAESVTALVIVSFILDEARRTAVNPVNLEFVP